MRLAWSGVCHEKRVEDMDKGTVISIHMTSAFLLKLSS